MSISITRRRGRRDWMPSSTSATASRVSDFAAVRRSGILGVIHKATEGGDFVDKSYAIRQPQAEQAGLLWGAYHFGTRPIFRGRPGAGFPVGRAAGALDADRARPRAQRRQSAQHHDAGRRPRPSCRWCARRPAGCRCSIPIRNGPMARNTAVAGSVWASRSCPARCWRAAISGSPTIARTRDPLGMGRSRLEALAVRRQPDRNRRRLWLAGPGGGRRRLLRSQSVRRRCQRPLPVLEQPPPGVTRLSWRNAPRNL